MKVKLRAASGIFGTLQLPELVIDPSGGDIIVREQKVEITDSHAFEAFVCSAVLDHSVTLDIVNGKGIMTALGMSTPSEFHKNMTVQGMEYIQIDILSLKKVKDQDSSSRKSGGVPVEAQIRLFNPSPLQIEIGRVSWALQSDYNMHSGGGNSSGLVDKLSAALKGHLKPQMSRGNGPKTVVQFIGTEVLTISRGETVFTVRGVANPSMSEEAIRDIAGRAGISASTGGSNNTQFYPCRLKGVKVESLTNAAPDAHEEIPAWMDKLVKIIDLPVGAPVDLDLAGMFLSA